jgi:single-stranded-DNA-specific exonuclease
MSRFVLGVERSVTGRPWRDRLDEQGRAHAQAIAQGHGLADVVARVLAARGVTVDTTERFLEPKLRDLLPEPYGLAGMEAAAGRLADAVLRGETVAIFGDYDVDGASSAALLAEFLRAAGTPYLIHIPDRLTEGYGPNVDAIRTLARSGAGLLATVDCGTTGHEPIAEAARLGLETVVLDHHQAPEALPDAVAVVNPNRLDDLSGLGHLCAAGVVFVTLVAVNRELRRRGFWLRKGREPDLLAWLDLVALGTVADVVPLVGLNRAFVRQGLAVMRRRSRLGLRALMDAARLDGPVEAFHLGYLLGPRINAGGRIGDAALGTRLLLATDEGEAERIAAELDRLNRERQALELQMVAEAEAQALVALGLHGDDTAPVIVAASADWHPGVIGLVAARLKERFGRPAFALALGAEGMATGSGRSIPGADLGRAVRLAVESGLAVKGGGHPMAGGVTLRADAIGAFRDFVAGQLASPVADARAGDHLAIDAALTAGGARPDLVGALGKAGPFGSGHPEPVFVLPGHHIVEAAEVGTGHVRVRLRSGDGSTVAGIAFRAAGQPLGQALLAGRGSMIHAAGHLAIDRYGGGEKVQLRICDAAEVTGRSTVRA